VARYLALFLQSLSIGWVLLFGFGFSSPAGHAADASVDLKRADVTPAQSTERPPPDWHYGLYLDLSYPVDFNFPENHLWRSKSTTPRVNELTPNLGLVSVKKAISEHSVGAWNSAYREAMTPMGRSRTRNPGVIVHSPACDWSRAGTASADCGNTLGLRFSVVAR
jgi:hypothetical protein